MNYKYFTVCRTLWYAFIFTFHSPSQVIVSAKKDFQLKQHSCQSKTVLIDGREKNPNNIHWYANCFYSEKTHRAENNFLIAETYNGKCLHFLLHSEVLGTLGTTFDVINRGSFMSIAIWNPRRLFFIFSHVLNLTN